MDDNSNSSYWVELLKRSAFSLYIGSAEKSGRRFGLSPYKIKQYFSGLRDELREIDEEAKPSNSEDVGSILADIKAYMSGDTPPAKKVTPAVTLDDIMTVVQSNSDKIAAMESGK